MSKNGKQNGGDQRYICRGGCGKTFTDTGKLHGHRFTADQIGAAIRQCYAGTSYKQIAEDMEKRYDIPEPSKAAIYYWVRDFTDAALERMGEYPAETSGEWVADESVVKVGGESPRVLCRGGGFPPGQQEGRRQGSGVLGPQPGMPGGPHDLALLSFDALRPHHSRHRGRLPVGAERMTLTEFQADNRGYLFAEHEGKRRSP